ncbi:LysR family transcriptional regulator [Kocuria massiliensis]|uniref:LysR family transcriptional regulator n=1 Tax=Kocuria massiliensis TaxID=1926282 RepID=UPI000A1CC509|nr:LysR family transcriptional regulator [Kocuria massiliensis]
MLNVHRLILLRELDSRGSLSAVARDHDVSPAAVSQHLSGLEKDVGIALTERVGRRILLTPSGKKLARRADQIVEILEAAEAELDDGRARIHGTVRLSSFGSFAVSYFADILHRMKSSHPDVTVEFNLLEPEAAVSSLLGRRTDVAITDEFSGRPQPVDTEMNSVHLFRDRIVAYSPWPVASLEDLRELPWVFETSGTTASDWAKGMCRRAGFEPKVSYESSDLRFHHDLVQAGMAAAFLPDMVFDNGVNPLDRPPHPITWPEAMATELYRDLYALTRRGARLRPATAALLNHTVEATRAAIT